MGGLSNLHVTTHGGFDEDCIPLRLVCRSRPHIQLRTTYLDPTPHKTTILDDKAFSNSTAWLAY